MDRGPSRRPPDPTPPAIRPSRDVPKRESQYDYEVGRRNNREFDVCPLLWLFSPFATKVLFLFVEGTPWPWDSSPHYWFSKHSATMDHYSSVFLIYVLSSRHTRTRIDLGSENSHLPPHTQQSKFVLQLIRTSWDSRLPSYFVCELLLQVECLQWFEVGTNDSHLFSDERWNLGCLDYERKEWVPPLLYVLFGTKNRQSESL